MATMEFRPGLLSTRGTADYPISVRGSGETAVIDNLSGRWAARTYAGNVHFFKVAAVTIPVNASALVSVCGIYNPPSSGKILEILDAHITQATATTVVQAFVWVSSTVSASALATFTTAGTARNRRMQMPSSTVARVYTAVTHSGTPDVEAFIAGYAKVTSDMAAPFRDFNGSLMIPEGVLASVCTLTAASAASSSNIGITWADLPV